MKIRILSYLLFEWDFYGSDIVDNYTLELRKEADDIKDRIIFTGYIDYDDMPSIYHLGNVAVLPSMWDEPVCMTMVEAVVSRLPLITTNSGGIPEYIPNDLAIILERDRDIVENIANSIKLIKKSNQSKHCDTIIESFNLRHYYKRFMEIILYDKRKECFNVTFNI